MSSNIQTLILHAHDTGPNPYKVAILLEALQLPYQVKLWQFGEEANGVKGPEFTKINENGRVPALEDPNTGVVSWESGAVVNYILRVYDKDSKFGAGPSEQDKVDFDKWVFFLVSSLGPMTGQCNWFRHYHSSNNEDAYKRFQEQTYRTYGVLENQLKKSDGRSMLEKGYTAVDMHFYPWLLQHDYAGCSVDSYPNVKKWLDSMAQRPDIKAAYENVKKGEKV
ncbi:hypothetical protein MMC16_000304 [Acarospora aff. strigata]|nr:hypothetical protein [Acarospora aff. strigata]